MAVMLSGLLPEMAGAMRFEVLGPVRVSAGSRAVTIARRERVLLAVLLLHANRTVGSGLIIDAIWGDRPPAEAAGQVHSSVYRLRNRLSADGLPRGLIITDPAGYQLQVDPQSIDLVEFRELRNRARTAAVGEDLDAAAAGYRAALELWRGPALADVDSDLVRRAAAGLDEERLQAVEERIEVELSLGRGRELVAELTDLVSQHPHRERLHCALMLALYRAARQADALAAYRNARQLLHDELGIEPGAELQEMHHAILNRSPEPEQPAQPVPGPVAEAARPTVPRELPADVAGFTGRADALNTLDELLTEVVAESPAPVVISAIAGTAGVGKTALAVHWAHQVANRFPDGQLYINLRGHAPGPPLAPIEALGALLRALGVSPDQIPPEQSEAAALYRTHLADRQALVVLDNARSADQVRPLLPGSPGILALVTSRNRLAGLIARDGARRITLDVLTPLEARMLLARLLGEVRVQEEPDAAVRLAEACARLPLALRIAAANLADRPGASIEGYVDELRSGELLAALVADGDEEGAVRSALEISYRAVPEPARKTFRLLGLAPGPDISAAAAAALVGTVEAQVEPLLRQLTNAHLLEEHAPRRFAFHDLLRGYARELAEAEDTPADQAEAVHRLLEWYLYHSDSAANVLAPGVLRLPLPDVRIPPAVVTFDDPGDATEWVDAERGNLIAAIRLAADLGPRPVAWLLADSLRGYLWHSGRKADWRMVANLSLAAAEHECDLPAQAAIRMSLGDLYVSLGEYQHAIEQLGTALSFARRSAWPEAESTTIGKLGIAYWHLGFLDRAAEMLSQSLALSRKTGRLLEQAITLGNLGNVLRELGRLQAAAEQYRQSVEIHREHGSRGEMIAMNNLGVASHELGQLERAVWFGTQALQMSREHGSRYDEACALDSLAAVRRDIGHRAQALELAQLAVDLARRIGDRRTEADALNTLGSIQTRLGQIDHAIRSHEQASNVAQRIGTRVATVVAAIGVADAHSRLGSHDEAHRHARAALVQAREFQYRVLEGQALTVLARVHLRRGQNDHAIEAVQDALANHRDTGHRLGEASALIIAGQIAQAVEDATGAGRSWRAARDVYAATGAIPPDDLPEV